MVQHMMVWVHMGISGVCWLWAKGNGSLMVQIGSAITDGYEEYLQALDEESLIIYLSQAFHISMNSS